jgi:hypothetical protein
MEALIPQLIAAIPTAALPLVFVIVACWFIYWKIQSQRKVTKTERDNAHDDLDKRLTLVEHDVQFMKEQNSLFADKLDRILDELCSIKIELAKKEDK